MPVPTIDTTQSVLGFRQYEPFTFQPSATNSPLRWSASGLPPGVTIETHYSLAATALAATDLVTAPGNAFANGHEVYFESLTGGAGLVVNTIYYVRDRSGDDFKLSAYLGGPVINITTDLTAASIRRVSTGAVSGASTAAGIFVPVFRAINGDGTSAQQTFTFGFETAPGLPDDDGLDLYMDVNSGQVMLSDPAGGTGRVQDQEQAALAGLFAVKVRDKRLIRVHLRKGGNIVDLTLTGLRFTAVEFKGEPVQLVVGDEWEKPAGKTYHQMVADFGEPALIAAISSYEDSFVGFFEIELRRNAPFNGGTAALVSSSRSIPVRLEIDLDQL
jgi:hypothetical protein